MTGTLRRVANENPGLAKAVDAFRKGPSNRLADDIIRLAKAALKPLNGESKVVIPVLRRLFVGRNYLAHMAALYEIEATKYDELQNSAIASQLYMEAAKYTSEMNTKIECFSRAFYTSLSAKNIPNALDAALQLRIIGAAQGMATLYYDAGKMCEALGKNEEALIFYSNAVEGDYLHILKAKAGYERLITSMNTQPAYSHAKETYPKNPQLYELGHD